MVIDLFSDIKFPTPHEKTPSIFESSEIRKTIKKSLHYSTRRVKYRKEWKKKKKK